MVRVKGKSTTKSSTKKTVKKNTVNVNTESASVENVEKFDYDPQAELDELNKGLEVNVDMTMPDIVNETIEELNKSKDLSNVGGNGVYRQEDLEEIGNRIEKLSSLEEMLEKDIKERINNLTDSQKRRMNNLTTSFWGGVLNNW